MPRIPTKGNPRIFSVSHGGLRQTSLMSFFTSSDSDTSKLRRSSNDPGNGNEKDEGELKEKDIEKQNGKVSRKSDTESPTACTPSKRTKLDSESETEEENCEIRDRVIHSSSLFNIVDKNMGSSWFEALESNFAKPYFAKLNRSVTTSRVRGIVYPPAGNVWEWTKHGNIQDVKVVILGQDPYHGPDQAHGLSFSVLKGVPLPPSLQNMFKELEQENIGFVRPNHGCLTGWAEQGVLLLNAVLTVEAQKPNSHKDIGWEKLTDSVISWISGHLSSVVFLLWGAYAQKKAAIVDKKKHYLLQCPHPSPLSAHKGFLGSNCFARCNELLEKAGKKPINWGHLP